MCILWLCIRHVYEMQGHNHGKVQLDACHASGWQGCNLSDLQEDAASLAQSVMLWHCGQVGKAYAGRTYSTVPQAAAITGVELTQQGNGHFRSEAIASWLLRNICACVQRKVMCTGW